MKMPLLGTLVLGLLTLAALLLPGWPVLVPRQPSLAGLFLGHAAHLSLTHLLWSGSSCLLFSALVERQLGGRRYLALLLLSAVLVSAGIMIFAPHISSCRGLSGLGHAFAAAWACGLIVTRAGAARLFGLALLAALLAKVGFEATSGHLIWSPPLGGRPLPASHVSGVFAGLVVSLGLLAWGRWSAPGR